MSDPPRRVEADHHFHAACSSELTTHSAGQRLLESSTIVDAARSAMSAIDRRSVPAMCGAEDDVQHAQKRIIRIGRFLAHHVQPRAGNVSGEHGVTQVGFHNQAAACGSIR